MGTKCRPAATTSDVKPDDRSTDHTACEPVREILSARVDGEAAAAEIEQADRHLATCVACRAYQQQLSILTRQVRVRPAEPVPDLVDRVVARARPARLGRGSWMRPALAWVAVVMLVQSVPALILGDAAGTSAHTARHLGAFGAALAIGFAYAAWRPHRAFGLLPFTAALVVTTVVSAVADATTGGVRPLSESTHVAEVAGLVLLWAIAGAPGWPFSSIGARRRSAARSAPPRSATT